MASNYLNSCRSRIDDDVRSEIARIEADCYMRRPKSEPDHSKAWIGGAAAGIAAWILSHVFWVGLAVFVAGGLIISAVMDSNYKSTISALEAEKARRTAQAKADGDTRFAREKSAFQKRTTDARMYYGKRLVNGDKAVSWLLAQFDRKIRDADRRPHIKEVTAPFVYTVSSDEIRTGADRFDFTVELYNHVTEFTNQVGLAQAMAKILQYQALRRYPSDPSDKTHYPARVNISANDNTITLTYVAANGNYQHARSF